MDGSLRKKCRHYFLVLSNRMSLVEFFHGKSANTVAVISCSFSWEKPDTKSLMSHYLCHFFPHQYTHLKITAARNRRKCPNPCKKMNRGAGWLETNCNVKYGGDWGEPNICATLYFCSDMQCLYSITPMTVHRAKWLKSAPLSHTLNVYPVPLN